MDRRTYISLTATTAIAGIAGCQTGDSDETEDGTPDETTVADWRKWIPAELVGEGSQVLMLDTNRAKAELPANTYEQFQIAQIANALGIEESNIDRMTGVQQGENASNIVLTGSYNPSEIIDDLGTSESDITEYSGYKILQEQFAIGSDAIIVAQSYETLIDTKNGQKPYLGKNDDDWNQLLTSIQDSTLAVAAPGTIGDDPTIAADKSGVTIDAADGGGATISIYVHYESESAAEEAMDTAREEFVSGASGTSDVDIQRFEREGNRIIVEGTTPNFDF